MNKVPPSYSLNKASPKAKRPQSSNVGTFGFMTGLI